MKENHELQITTYRVPVRAQKSAPVGAVFRIALVADLHNRRPDEALRALESQKPDIIAIAGDVMESCRPLEQLERELSDDLVVYSRLTRATLSAIIRADHFFGGLSRKRQEFDRENKHAYAFLRGAVRIAPVYYEPGNHEKYLTAEEKAGIGETGAVFLENASAPLDTPLGKLHIGGIPTRFDDAWLKRFCSLSGIKVLLCHHPEYFCKKLDGRGIDIVLSGHAHGGQWRVFGRGLFAPGQGLFPRLTSGMREGAGGSRLIISRGLSNTAHVGRLNNPTELVMVEVVGGNAKPL